MSAKKTSGAVMTSLIVHGVAFVIGGIYLVTQTQQFKTFIGAEVLQAKEPPKPQVRKRVFKQIKPTVPTTNTVVVKPIQLKHRVTSVRTTSIQPETVLDFSNKVVKLEDPINPNIPKVVSANAPVPQYITHADLPVSDAPGALAFSSPIATAPSAAPASIGRGIGGIVQVKLAFERPGWTCYGWTRWCNSRMP